MRARLGLVSGALLYAALLYSAYTVYGPLNYGAGANVDLPLPLVVLGFLYALVPPLLMPTKIERPSQACYAVLYLIVIVPCMFIPYGATSGSPWDMVPLTTTLMVLFSALGLVYRVPLVKLKRLPVPEFGFDVALLLFAAALILVTMATTNLTLDLSLGDVYERRLEARETTGTSTLTAYAYSWLGNGVSPFLIALGIARRKWLHILVGIVGLLLVFSLTGLKSTFFTPILLLGTYTALKLFPKASGAVGTWLASGAVALAGLEFFVIGTWILPHLILHRLLFTPANLTTYYFEYFSKNAQVMLSDSFLSGFVERQYDKSVGGTIGEVYYQSDVMNATTGIWAQGYAHFGFIGMIVVTALVGFFFLVFDSATRPKDLLIGAMMMALTGIFWANVSLHTSLVSNAILLTLLLIWLLPEAAAKGRRGSA